MPDARGEGFGWRLDVALLVGAWAWLLALHPPVGFLWAEYPRIVYTYLPLPFSLEGMKAAIAWQATVHTPGLVRPVRAIQWWLAAKALGCSPPAYFVAMAAALGVAIWAVARIAWHVTGRRATAVFVAACLAVSYANAYSLLFFGFGLTAAAAFGGLAAYFRAEELEGRARAWRHALAFLLLAAGGLAHETFLALALVPGAHALITRRPRAVMARALAFVAVVPLYALAGLLMQSVYRAGVLLASTPRPTVWRYPLALLAEISGRGGFTVLSGGLPFDPLRALPWAPEFSRLREFALTPAGLATTAMVVAPCLVLTALALAAGAGDAAVRRRLGFCAAWLGFSGLPLVFPFLVPMPAPVAAPEAFHLTGALPALFLIWAEAFRGRRGRALALGVVAIGLWLGIHGTARWVLFHRDLPQMARSVHALETVFAGADARGEEARVLFFPIQIGAHYGFIPTIQPLYPTQAARACALGDRVPGCLTEPAWIWRAAASPPSPRACRTADGVRVGPLTAPMLAQLEGSRRILVGSGAEWATRYSVERAEGQRLVSGCPLLGIEEIRRGPERYWLYRAAGGPNVRWYRFGFEPGPAVLPVPVCDDR